MCYQIWDRIRYYTHDLPLSSSLTLARCADGESRGLAEGESFLMISTSRDKLKGRLREAGKPMVAEVAVEDTVVVEEEKVEVAVVMDGLPGLLLLLVVVPIVLVSVVPIVE